MSTFFERLGGFLFFPAAQSKDFFNEPQARKEIVFANLLVQLLAVVLGFVVMFMLFYPEFQWYPDAIKEGLNLFAIPLGNPYLLLAGFGLGYLILFFVNFVCIGSVNYGTMRWLVKRSRGEAKMSYFNFMSAHGFAQAPLGLFCVFNICWLYFFERVNYAKVFFPFVDFSLPVVVYFCVLGACLAWKWYIEGRILYGCGLGKHACAGLVGLEVLFLACCITFIAVVGNIAVPMFS